MDASLRGAILEIPPSMYRNSNLDPLSGLGTVSGGQFVWGGFLLKCIGGAQRSPQCVWKSHDECKGKRWLDCKRDISSSYESRA